MNYRQVGLTTNKNKARKLLMPGSFRVIQEGAMIGIKHDERKPRWELLPTEPIEEVVRVLTYGAEKYADDNWLHVKPFNDRYYSAALRHIIAWRQGEIEDPETGFHHLAHAMCCLTFLMAGGADDEANPNN